MNGFTFEANRKAYVRDEMDLYFTTTRGRVYTKKGVRVRTHEYNKLQNSLVIKASTLISTSEECDELVYCSVVRFLTYEGNLSFADEQDKVCHGKDVKRLIEENKRKYNKKLKTLSYEGKPAAMYTFDLLVSKYFRYTTETCIELQHSKPGMCLVKPRLFRNLIADIVKRGVTEELKKYSFDALLHRQARKFVGCEDNFRHLYSSDKIVLESTPNGRNDLETMWGDYLCEGWQEEYKNPRNTLYEGSQHQFPTLGEERAVRTKSRQQGLTLSTAEFFKQVKKEEDMRHGIDFKNLATDMVAETASKNKEAFMLAAKLEVGKEASKQLKRLVKPKLPMVIRGYADHAFFDLVLANIVSTAVKEIGTKNKKACIVAEAMLQSAYVEAASKLNLGKILDDVLKGIDISKLVESSDDESEESRPA